MKTAYCGLAWLVVAVLAFAAASLIETLPVTNDGYAAKVYESWSGVVKIWYCGGWKPGNGSFAPWLNKAASRFERKHPGVRAQITSVDGGDLRDFASAESPPDVILFSPGEVTGEGLAPLDAPDDLREALKGVGEANGAVCALPVAMGGYAWAVNTALIDGVPYDWSGIPDLSDVKKQKRYIMDVPADSEHYCWSGALCALLAPRRVFKGAEGGDTRDIDLGLGGVSPEPTAAPESEIVICRLPRTLGEDFRTRASVLGLFTSGRVAAIPVTQLEIRNLARLGQSGKGVSWKVEPGGGAFSDQLLIAAAPDIEREDREARLRLSKRFISLLLDEESQKGLSSIRAFSVTDSGDLYAGEYGMGELERAVSGAISVPNAFDASFRDEYLHRADALINPE